MSVAITVDVAAPTPVYEQIRTQIAELIALGDLGDGDRLPTVRALAADLGVAVNTVGRAYAALEAAGRVTSARRRGTVVTGPAAGGVPPELAGQANLLARVALASGTDPETTVAALRSAFRRLAAAADPLGAVGQGG